MGNEGAVKLDGVGCASSWVGGGHELNCGSTDSPYFYATFLTTLPFTNDQ
jgi:hypothetical protein